MNRANPANDQRIRRPSMQNSRDMHAEFGIEVEVRLDQNHELAGT
ncbi:MAG: hypothetical protein JWM58_1436 [Rhizobium sp.]|nr:hypothetical protein [Rhizobium sp.]